MNAARRIGLALLLLSALMVLSACTPSASDDAGELVGVKWALVSSSSGSANMDSYGITAQFNSAKMSGYSGVNQYGGPYTAEKDGTFRVGEIVSTLMAGEPNAMKAEQTYLALLAECDTYKVADGRLTLSVGEEARLVFEQADAAVAP